MAIFRSVGNKMIKSKIRNLTERFRLPKKNRLFSAIKRARKAKASSAKHNLFRQNAFALEQLEPRLLLSADPLAAAFVSDDVTLKVSDDLQFIQLIDNNAGGALLGQKEISKLVAGDVITITGTAADDKLTVDQSFLDLGEQSYVVRFDGAGGHDTVATGSTVEQSSWQISADNAGSLGNNGAVEFLSIEEIQADNSSSESSHVLSAINQSYQWLIQQDNQGLLASLEAQQYNQIPTASTATVKFSGFDTLVGSGTDQLNYSQYGASVTVDLETGDATGFSEVSGIKTIVGSNQNDILAGDTNDNNFVVDFGDTVIGAGGYDVVTYVEQGTSGIDVRLSQQITASDFTYHSGDWDATNKVFTDNGGVIIAEDIDFLSAFGGTGDNYFDFSVADLQVHLDGGAGADHLIGGALDDLLTGGAGVDLIDGGEHVLGDEIVEIRAADFLLDGDKLKIDNEEDTLINIENLYLRALTADTDTQGKTLDARLANAYNITLTGSELNDLIYASDHGDTLIGLGGADTITAGAGVDTFSESFTGRAILSYTGSNAVSGSDYSLDLAQGDNEKWQLTRPASTVGDGFTLTITPPSGVDIVIAAILWNSTAADVATVIEKALGLDFGHLSVQLTGDVWDIEFVGLYGAQQMATGLALQADNSADNSATASISQVSSTEIDTLLGFDTDDILALSGSFSADYVDVGVYAGLTTIDTYGGQDTIKAGSGINTIAAGAGNDIIYLQGKSADTIDAGTGSDKLVVDLSLDVNNHTITLKNHQLVVDANTVILSGLESVYLLGSSLDDAFDASDFHGVSASTSLANIEGWSELSEHTLRITLDDTDSTIIDVDLSALATIEELLELLNSIDDRDPDAFYATFDQETAKLIFNGLSNLTVAGSSSLILDILGLTAGDVPSTVLNGISLSLLAGLQLTSQKGNGGNDTLTGSKGNDSFSLGLAGQLSGSTVVGGAGVNTLSVNTAVAHTTIELTDSLILWKGTAPAVDVSASFSQIDTVTLTATTGAVLLDASSVTVALDVVLDAGTSNVLLESGLGSNVLKIDITGRSLANAINVTVLDAATHNEVVFYGGAGALNSDDFKLVNVTDNTAVDYTVERTSDLSIDQALSFLDRNVTIKTSGTLTINADVITDSTASKAGNISFQGKDIIVADGVTISAQGLTLANSGNITLLAIDEVNSIAGLGFFGVDVNNASIIVNAATIQGKDITIYAVAESDPLTPTSRNSGALNVAQEFGSNIIDTLGRQSLIAGYVSANVTATVNIAAGAVIQGDNISIKAKAIARVTASPISIAFVLAIGNLKSTADVQVHGTLIANSDVEIISQTSNYLDVQARPLFGFDTSIKGFAASVAVGILDSTNNAKVSDTANIIANGNLTLQARTFDYVYVLAESDAGISGKMATGVAVHLEKGDTTASLAGKALVKGNIKVEAVQRQGKVDGNWGTEVSGLVDRVPSVIGKYWDKAKSGLASAGASIPFVSKMLTPSDRLAPTKFTVGIAFAYVKDINNVSAYIGEVGKNSDIQAGGSLDLLASADARLLTSVSSVSKTPSKISQIPGASGAFAQVPFGGAVSVTINSLDNNVLSQVQGNTQLDVLGIINNYALAQNLTGLLDKDTTINYVQPRLVSQSQVTQAYSIAKNDLLRFDTSEYDWQQTVASEQPELSSYWLGAVYKYLGDEPSITLATEDFSDFNRWERLGNMITSLPSQLFGGVSDLYLIDNQASSVAAGAKFSIALNAMILTSKQSALAKVLTGAQINQRDVLSSSFTVGSMLETQANALLSYTPTVVNRELKVQSKTINKSIDYTGTTTSTESLLGAKVNALKGASGSLNGVGAGVLINTVTTNSQAIIESGTSIKANKILVDAKSEVFGVSIGYASGSGSGNLGVAGLYIGNTINSTTIAQIQSGAEIIAAKLNNSLANVELKVTADNRVDIIILAGGISDGGSVGFGASAAVTNITKVTKALIGSAELASAKAGTVSVDGDIIVNANSTGLLIGAAVSSAMVDGKVAPSGGEKPAVVNSSYGVAVSGAFIYNKADYTTLASVSNLLSLSADKLSVTSYEGGGVYAFPIAFATATANKFALAAAGIGLVNDVDITLGAAVTQINSVTLTQLTIKATNDSTIVTTSLSLALADIAKTSVGSSSSIALTGNVSINNVTNNIDAYLSYITTMNVSGANAAGVGVDITARDESEIYAIAAGVAYAGSGAVGVTYAENNITSNTDALLDTVDLTMSTGSVTLTADSEADILSIALGAAVAMDSNPDFDSKLGLSVAAAISANVVRANTRAKTNNATITLPNQNASLAINATNNSDIIAIVVAASVAQQSGGTTSISLSGAGASVSNSVYGDTEALLSNSNIDQDSKTVAANTNVTLLAKVTGKLVANVFGASIALAGATSGTGVAGSIGVSLATNNLGKDPENSNVANKISALITDTSIDVSGAVSSTAESTQTIIANVVAVSVALAKSTAGSAGALSGVGASTTNNIKVDISSVISASSARKSVFASSLNVYAKDTSKISSVVVGASIAGSYSPTATSFTLSIAVSLAENNIDSNLNASVDNIQLGSGTDRMGTVTVKAKSTATIEATSVAVSLAVALGSNGASVSLSGGGADAHNKLIGSAAAKITGSIIYSSAAVTVKAENTAIIDATVAAVALAVSVGDPAIGVAIGAAVSRNDIGTSSSRYDLSAYLQDSSVDTSGALRVESISSMTITAGVGAGAMAIAGSATGAGLSGAGSGVSTINTINADISAVVKSTSAAQTILASSLSIYAEDTSKITAVGVGVSIAGSFSPADPSVALAIGVSLSENNIDNNLSASLNNILLGSLNQRTGAVTVKAKSDATITATSVAASLAVALGSSGLSLSLSGAGADAHNKLSGTTSATVINSVIYSAAAVNINAENNATIKATVVAVAAAVSVGDPAIGISIGAAISRNDIGESSSRFNIESYLKNSSVDSTGGLIISAINDMTITAGVGAGALAVALSSGVGVSAAGSGVSTTNNIYAKTAASVINSSDTNKSLSTASLTVSAVNTATINATAGSASLGLAVGADAGVSIAVAASLAYNTIDSLVAAKVYGVQGSSAQIVTGSMSVLAQDTSTITAKVVGVALAAGFGKVGVAVSVAAVEAENNVSNQIDALISGIEIETKTAGLSVSALEDTTVTLDAEAAAVAIAGGKAAVAVSGAGVGGSNTISNKVNAKITGSKISTVTVAQDVTVLARNTTTVTANIGAASISAAVGLGGGAGAIGVALLTNSIGDGESDDSHQSEASISNSSITALRDVKVQAFSHTTISSSVYGASVAVAGGKFAVAGAGVGITLNNTINGSTLAYIDSSAVLAGRDLIINADATAKVTKAEGNATAVAVAVGLGGAVAISATTIDNSIAMNVDSYLNLDNSRTLGTSVFQVLAENNLEVSSKADARFNNVKATAVTISGGLVGATGGGVGIYNEIDNRVDAKITGSGEALVGAKASVKSDETTELNVAVTNVAVSVSIGASIGVALVRNDVKSRVNARINHAKIIAANIDLLASADNQIKQTTAVGFSASLGALAVNIAAVDITTIVEATTDAASLSASDTITISATSTNYARAQSSGGAAGGIAIGAMIAKIEQGVDGTNEVVAQIGDNSVINAAKLLISAAGIDDILPKSTAGGGGLVSAVGSQSDVTSYQAAVANIGKGVTINATTLNITAQLDQKIDASADAYSVGLLAGAGAGLGINVKTLAEVNIGASTNSTNPGSSASVIRVHDMKVNALNNFDKSVYANGKSLRSGSASIASISVLSSITSIDNKATVNLTDGVQIIADGSYDDTATIYIEAINDIKAVDSISLETVALAGGINVAISQITATSESKVNLNNAVIDNVTGSVYITTKTDSENRASADVLAISGLQSASGAGADVDTNATNTINIVNAKIKAGDIFLYAGKSRTGVLNILESSSNVEITSVSTSVSINAPNPQADIVEVNNITIGANTQLKAMRDVTIEAREGIGASDSAESRKRAQEAGLTLSISAVPYGFEVDRDGEVSSSNNLSVDATASIIAGVNNKSFLQVRPIEEVQSILDNHVDAAGVINVAGLNQQQKELLFGVPDANGVVQVPEIPSDIVYVMQALDVATISFKVTQDTVIKHGDQYYRYLPIDSIEADLLNENYFDTSRWQNLTSVWNASFAAVYSVYESTVTAALTTAMTNQFYVIKPQELEAPTLTFTNLSTILFEQKAQVEGWMLSHGTNAEAIARYQVQLAQINSKIADLGLADLVHKLEIGQVIKAADGSFYASVIKQKSMLSLEDFQDTNLWAAVASTANYWNYDDTAHADPDSTVYNRELDMLMVDLPNVYASPGSVYIQIDGKAAATLAAQSNMGNIKARAGATIQVVNSTPFSLRVNDLVVLDAQRVENIGGVLKTYTPGAVQFNYKDVNSVAVRAGVTHSNGSDLNNTQPVEVNQIILFQDTKSTKSSYGDFRLPPIPQNMYIQGNIVNENGSAYINNKDGSIEVSKQIRAETINLFAAGDFSLNSEAWYHTNKDPRQYINYSNLRSLVYATPGGELAFTLGAVPGMQSAIDSDNSQILSMGKITITARHLNVNGLIQSGVNTVYLKVDAAFYGGAYDVELANIKGQAIAGISFSNPSAGGNVKVPVNGYWDAGRRAIVIEDIIPSGGEVVLSGQIISTGNGRIVAASGYASVEIINNSLYELIISDIDTRKYRQGTVTLIDSATLKKDVYQHAGALATHTSYQGTLVVGDATTGTISKIDYVQIGTVISQDSSLDFEYQVKEGTRYVWTEGQKKTETQISKYEKKSFNLFGDNALADWLVADSSYKWRTVEFTDQKPLLESESIVADIPAADEYKITYLQTAGDTSVNKIDTDTWTTGGGWLRKKTVHTKVTVISGLKDYYTHSLKADHAINVSFLSGNSNADVKIFGMGNITLAGRISMPDQGILEVVSAFGSVTMSDGVYALTREAHIVAMGNISLVLEGNFQDRGHTLISYIGSIDLGVVEDDNPGEGQVSSNKVYLDRVYAKHNVSINSGGGIYRADSSTTTTITADSINLAALGGAIGSLTIDSAITSGSGTLTVKALGHVDITEVAGNLNVASIIAAQEVNSNANYGIHLTTLNGSILDANTDTAKVASLNTENAQYFYAQSHVVNLATQNTADYHQYWQGLRTDASGTLQAYQADVSQYANYDSLFSHLSGAELSTAQDTVAQLNASYTVDTLYNSSYDQLGALKVVDSSGDITTNSQFKRDVLAQKAVNQPLFDSILSPGIVAKLYPGTPIIGGAGASSAEVANIQAQAVGSKITLTVNSGGIGKIGDRVVIDMSAGVVALSATDKQLLSAATGNDVIATDYLFYRYTGGDAQISQFDIKYTDPQWQAVSSIKVTDTTGTRFVTNGAYVELSQEGIPVLFQYTGSSKNIDLTVEDYEVSGGDWDRIISQSVAPALTLDLLTNDIVMQLQNVTLQLWDDLNLAGNASLTATANAGIAIEHSGDLILDQVIGGSWVRLDASAGIVDNSGVSNAVISAGDLVLIARGNIQAADGSAFKLQLADSANLSVDTSGLANLWQVEGAVNINGSTYQIGDLQIADVTAVGSVTIGAGILNSGAVGQAPSGNASIMVQKISTAANLTLIAAANIEDAFDDLSNAIINIRSVNLHLSAGGKVGRSTATSPNYLDFKISGAVSANTGDDIYLNAVESNLMVADIASKKDVYLKASLSILDSESDNSFQDISLTGTTDIKAISIHLNALKGGIGQFGNQLEIDTDAANAGLINSYSFYDTYLRETSGALKLGNLVADSDNSGTADADIYLVAENVLNGGSAGFNLLADKVRMVAADSIGAGLAISSQINYLEAQAVTGSIDWLNTGHLQLGAVTDQLSGVSAAGNINIAANSPLTVLESVLSNSGDIILSATDSAANTDILTFASTGSVEATLGSVTLNAGDELIVAQGASLKAHSSLVLNTDLGNTDSAAATVALYGKLSAAKIEINTGIGNDQVLLDVQLLNGDTYVNTGDGDDLITINQLHSRADKLQLDGGQGTDSYVINRTANNAGYVIDVVDSGTADSGADTLTINGTSAADSFLLRANFVAALHVDASGDYAATVERINYNANINARLTINGHDGNDHFYSDDNSSITTLDGGAGDDTFQIGQLFADDRLVSLGNVALGDQISTTETTLGFLSFGNSLPMVIYGGDGKDNIKVYSNKSTIKLYGEDGDDNFVVRAFLKKGSSLTAGGGDIELFGGDGDDSIQYSINSPLSIDGGNGTDSVVILGTEADDSFVITDKGIFGAGLNVGFTGVELAEVDGLEGDDIFYILSTNANMVTTIIGGLGADTFNVAGDVTTPIVSYSVEGRSSFINHSVASDDAAYNGIFVSGLALNVADSKNGAVKIDAIDGQLLVGEDGLEDSYQISMDVATPSLATLAFITVSAARASTSDKSLANNGLVADSVLVSVDNVNFYESLVIRVDSTGNWADKHQIYVRAVNDNAVEGQRDYVISHSISSANPEFDGLNIANIEVTVNDNDKADLIVTSSVNPYAVEAGVSQTYNLRLATAPAAGEKVTVTLAEIIPTGLIAQLSVDKPSLVFDSNNWDQIQNFVITAIDDTAVENLYQANIALTTSSNISSDYASLADIQVNLSIVDNDTGAVVVSSTGGSTVVSASNTDDYSLSLSKKPTAAVTISLLNDQQIIITSTDSRFDSATNTVTFGIDDGDWDKAIVLIISPNPSYQPDTDQQPVQKFGLQAHTLDNIRGKLVIDGGVPADKQRTLIGAVMLPTELDGELLITSLAIDESQQTDRLHLFNDGSVIDDVDGILTATSITGLGMGVGLGIDYSNIEVLQTYLGIGDDQFEIAGTAAGSINVIHGGGGNDSLTVTASNSASALILLGDSVQDGSSYNATSDQKTAFAREFNNPGNDIIDASGAGGSVVIYGGQGNDQLTGSGFGDHIVGGSGTDNIFGLEGNDHIYGDSGVNLDLSIRLDLSSQILHIVNTADAANDNPETADTLQVARDIIDGGAGDDIILADKGIITQISGTNRILTTAAVINITNTNRGAGGDDSVVGGSGNDIIIGGLGEDTLAGGTDNDVIIGDHGTVELNNGQVTRAYSIPTTSGNIDNLSGNGGNDTIIGGFGGDVIAAGAGNDTVIGDHGQIDFVNGIRRHAFSTDTNASTGGNDIISLGTGEDQAIGGVGADRITNTAGETLMIGDDGEIFSDASGRYILARTGNTTIGGEDFITGGRDRDIIFGGFGADILDGAAGDDIIGGDGSQITRNANNIIFETIDFFVGGDDTLLGGPGLDRMMGGFGSDLFYANLREDIVLGEYGRFTFAADASGAEQATFIISLAQGKLDLIRQTQTSLFTNFAQQVFERSELGAVARGRTAISTQFSQDADAALGRLNQRNNGHGSQSVGQVLTNGVDFVIPTEATAAGAEQSEEPVAEEELRYDEDGFLIPAETDAEAEAAAKAQAEAEAENVDAANPQEENAEEPQCVLIEGETETDCVVPATTDNQDSQQQDAKALELELELQKLQNSAAANDTAPVNLQAALASFSGWALMGVSKSAAGKRKVK